MFRASGPLCVFAFSGLGTANHTNLPDDDGGGNSSKCPRHFHMENGALCARCYFDFTAQQSTQRAPGYSRARSYPPAHTHSLQLGRGGLVLVPAVGDGAS